MQTIYKWLNREKARYYTITVQKDLFGEIIINYCWGGCNSNRGGNKSALVQTQEKAQELINKMIKRRKSRGYELISF